MFRSKQNSSLPSHLTLEPNQALRVPDSVHEIQVLSGCAWVTVAGQDIILCDQQSASIPQSRYGAIISPINKETLELDLR
ncbi:MAG TPA: hypothetical protein V6D15_17380 [Oculatellaceae cyanobacterium]|jgi:hypothetical protein